MSFLSPLFLIGALTAAIPVILHLLKREPDARVRFAVVRLLKQGPVEHTRARHVRDLLLLALRVAALLLLALAFARPFTLSGNPSSSVTVIALDTSLSLSAPGQLERAKQLAREAIRRAPIGDRIGVVTFADEIRVASAVSSDRALAIAAVDAATTDFGATRYRAALQTAVDLADGSPATIVVVTDLQESGWDSGDRVALSEAVRIELLDVGALPPNLAIVAVRATRDQIVATVRNAAPEARDARVKLTARRGSQTVDGGDVIASIGPNQSAEVPFPKPAADTAVVSVSDERGIEGDNARSIVLDGAARPSVLVVTTTGDLLREAFYLRQALTAGSADGTAYGVEGAGAAELSTWDAARLETYSAVALLSTRGLEKRGRDLIKAYARSGGGVLVAAAPEVDGEVVADALGDPGAVAIVPPEKSAKGESRTLAPVDARHPALRVFGGQESSLAPVNFRQIAGIRGQECQSLARFTTGEAAVLDCATGEGRAILFASDLDNRGNDFPLRPTFVPFVHEVVRYLSGSRPHQSEYIVGEQPAGVPRTPGVAPLAVGSGPTRWVAVNVDPREADPGRMSAEAFHSAIARLKDAAQVDGHTGSLAASQQEDRQHLWQYVLTCVVALLMIESLVSTRIS